MEHFITYAIDFEGSLKTGILEYGIVGVDSKIGIFSCETNFCKNRKKIPYNESKIHKIEQQKLSKCEDFKFFLPKFINLRSKYFLCAHNAVYENLLLTKEGPIIMDGYNLDNYTKRNWGPWLDTYVLYRKFYKVKTYELNELISYCNLEKILRNISDKFCEKNRADYHCALYDAIACALLLLNFIRQREHENKTLFELLKYSVQCSFRDDIQQLKINI